MKKEKTVKTYQRRTKSGKMVTVHEHKAAYDAAEEARKAASKKAGAGSELASKKKAKEAGELPFTADEYKAWYHWDVDNDPKNPTALKVKKALIAKLSPRGYKKYFDEMTDSWSARGHLKAFKGVGDVMKDRQDLYISRKMAATHKAQAALADNLGAKDAAESFRKRSKEASARAKEIAERVKGRSSKAPSEAQKLLDKGYTEVSAKYTTGGHTGHTFNSETGEWSKNKSHKGNFLVSPNWKKVYKITAQGVEEVYGQGAWAAVDKVRAAHPDIVKLKEKIEQAPISKETKGKIRGEIRPRNLNGVSKTGIAYIEKMLAKAIEKENPKSSSSKDTSAKKSSEETPVNKKPLRVGSGDSYLQKKHTRAPIVKKLATTMKGSDRFPKVGFGKYAGKSLESVMTVSDNFTAGFKREFPDFVRVYKETHKKSKPETPKKTTRRKPRYEIGPDGETRIV